MSKKIEIKSKMKAIKKHWEKWKEAILFKDRNQSLENLRNSSTVRSAFLLWREAFLVKKLVKPRIDEADLKM